MSCKQSQGFQVAGCCVAEKRLCVVLLGDVQCMEVERTTVARLRNVEMAGSDISTARHQLSVLKVDCASGTYVLVV
jgi:hypothetical protein